MKTFIYLILAILVSGACLFLVSGVESFWLAMGTLMAATLIFAGLSACVYWFVSGFYNFFNEEM